MSTKIYFAIKCPIKLLPVFLPKYRQHCFKNVKKQVVSLLANVPASELKASFFKESFESYPSYEEFLKKREKIIRTKYTFKKCADASKSLQRDLEYGIDCSLNIWLYNNKAYIIQYGEHWIFDKFKLPEGVEDYCYYNNTDPPDGITDSQWEARGKMWNKLCLDNWDESRLVHNIVNAKEKIGLYEVASLFINSQNAMACLFY